MTMGESLGCQYCGTQTWHNGVCPRVKAIEYHPNGTTKRVELWPLEPVSGGKVDYERIARKVANAMVDVIGEAFDDSGKKQ